MKPKNCDVGNDNGVLPSGTVVYKRVYSGISGYNRAVLEGISVGDGVVPTARYDGGDSSRVPYKPSKRVLRCEHQSRKCRVPSLKVGKITIIKNTPKGVRKGKRTFSKGHSSHDPFFIYEVGKMAVPHNYSSNPEIICTSGIHVFRTLEEALNY